MNSYLLDINNKLYNGVKKYSILKYDDEKEI